MREEKQFPRYKVLPRCAFRAFCICIRFRSMGGQGWGRGRGQIKGFTPLNGDSSGYALEWL